jgi:hypothetical protein
MSDTTKSIVSPVSFRSKPVLYVVTCLTPKWNKWEWALVILTVIAALNMMAIHASLVGFHSPWLDWWAGWQLAAGPYWCGSPVTRCAVLVDMITVALSPALVVIFGLLNSLTPDQGGPQ